MLSYLLLFNKRLEFEFLNLFILALHVKSHSLQERDVLIVDRHVKKCDIQLLRVYRHMITLLKTFFVQSSKMGICFKNINFMSVPHIMDPKLTNLPVKSDLAI